MEHSSPLHHDDVARVLDSVRDTKTGHSLLALSKLDGFRLEDGRLSVALAASKEQAATLAPLCDAAKPALEKLPGCRPPSSFSQRTAPARRPAARRLPLLLRHAPKPRAVAIVRLAVQPRHQMRRFCLT